MALVIRSCLDFAHFWYSEKRDSRLEDWPLMGSPILVLGILVSYVYVSLSFGPAFMKDRPAFQLRGVINLYNSLQVIWNSYVAIYIFYWTIAQGDISLTCQSTILDETPRQRHIAIATYLYFVAKLIDLMDTVFFVLRKKNSHVTFLHVYHHALMVFATYIGVMFLPGGHSWLLGGLNSIVHVLMYTYYFITSSNTAMGSLGKWKKVLTQIQMLQFVVLAVHYAVGFFHECAYPRVLMFFGVVQNAFMFLMFSEFYYSHYVKVSGKIK